ncbi:hypothetical protein IFM89_019160 [Coptis chinensis]|uniref:rRNA biogenesis protein RRP36 n=1 Tax=Coptis chinensis TaxID=261450 RepID=A0A835GYY0_9MAGN|nr:hypothetical protein IFM89_019160 [Coptis chinensis]
MGKLKLDNMEFTSSKKKFDEHESSSEEEDFEIEREIESKLAHVSLEELQKARSNGFHPVHQKIKEDKMGGRVNKNRPMEISSKKPVGRFREVIQVPKQVIRDPRFESLCGNLDTDWFKRRYSFIYEAELPAEKEELKKLLKKSNDPEVIADLKNRLSSIDKQLKAGPSKHAADKAIVAEHMRSEREAAKEGKHLYHLKQSEIRKRDLMKKFNSLKTAGAGKLEAFIEKKRRKNASKDHRYVPYRRPNY